MVARRILPEIYAGKSSYHNGVYIYDMDGDLNSVLEDITKLGNSRELSLAKTKLEECVFWIAQHFKNNVVANEEEN